MIHLKIVLDPRLDTKKYAEFEIPMQTLFVRVVSMLISETETTFLLEPCPIISACDLIPKEALASKLSSGLHSLSCLFKDDSFDITVKIFMSSAEEFVDAATEALKDS